MIEKASDADLDPADKDAGRAPGKGAEGPPSGEGRLPLTSARTPPAPAGEAPLGHRVEALLFASGQALTAARLASVLGVQLTEVKAALTELTAAWAEREGAVDLVEIAGGFRFLTRAGFHADLAGLKKQAGPERLSPAALETLAVVAYRQPITRADVEAVRGVGVGPLLRLLIDRDLVKIAGRATEPGHPLLYATTKRFLDHFGLKSLKALPNLKDLLESP